MIDVSNFWFGDRLERDLKQLTALENACFEEVFRGRAVSLGLCRKLVRAKLRDSQVFNDLVFEAYHKIYVQALMVVMEPFQYKTNGWHVRLDYAPCVDIEPVHISNPDLRLQVFKTVLTHLLLEAKLDRPKTLFDGRASFTQDLEKTRHWGILCQYSYWTSMQRKYGVWSVLSKCKGIDKVWETVLYQALNQIISDSFVDEAKPKTPWKTALIGIDKAQDEWFARQLDLELVSGLFRVSKQPDILTQLLYERLPWPSTERFIKGFSTQGALTEVSDPESGTLSLCHESGSLEMLEK